MIYSGDGRSCSCAPPYQRKTRSSLGRNVQRGFSVMLVLVMIALVTGSLAVTFLSTFGTKARSERVTEAALAKAKDALIAYAASNAAINNLTRYGALPCPDATNDGYYKLIDDTTGSNCKVWVGRLPWATLGLDDLRDGSGERLWYAISQGFQPNPSGTGVLPLNSDTPGQLTVSGITPDTNVVAVIFAPGNPVGTQSRTAAAINDPLQYLESTNATSTTNFVTANASPTFNDRLITIRPAEIFRLIEKQVGPALRPFLAQYYTTWGRYPFAAPFNDPSNPANFIGVINTYEGLLPVTTTNPVTWNAGLSDINAGIVPLFNTCTGTTTLSCSAFVLGLLTLGSTVTITAYANNVGMAFVDPVPAGGITVTPTLNGQSITQSLDANGRATIVITGQISAPIAFLGTVTASIARPQPSAWLATSWITTNEWQKVSYYAIAPGFAPNGANACTPVANPCNPAGVLPANACLSICDSRLPLNLKANNIRALLLTTGPALSTLLSHPSALLSHYLEDGNQSVPDGTYEGGLITNTFNDQAAVLAPYP